MYNFLENTSAKIDINCVFLKYYNKVLKIQNFLRNSYKRKMERIDAMMRYWNELTDKADWNIVMSTNSGTFDYSDCVDK